MKKATVATVAFFAAAMMSAPAYAQADRERMELPGVKHFAEDVQDSSSGAKKQLAKVLKGGVDKGGTSKKKPASHEVAVAKDIDSIIAHEAKRQGVPVALVKAVVQVESSYRPDVTGAAGEIGLMQIKPATARMMGFKGAKHQLFDPATNIKYGVAYLAKAHKLGGGTTCGTILKYNAGHGAKRMNPISRGYCRKIERILGA